MSNQPNGSAEPPRDEDPELRAIYEKIRREFSAADLQKYTEIEPMIPAEEVLAELARIHEEVTGEKLDHAL